MCCYKLRMQVTLHLRRASKPLTLRCLVAGTGEECSEVELEEDCKVLSGGVHLLRALASRNKGAQKTD